MEFTFIRTTQFKKDVKKYKKQNMDFLPFKEVVSLLKTNQSLPQKYKLHPLKGTYKGYLECHLKPDWLLIYRVSEQEKAIYLVRMGSHADLFR